MTEFVKIGNKNISSTVIRKAAEGNQAAMSVLSSQGVAVRDNKIIDVKTGQVITKVPESAKTNNTIYYEAGKEVPVSPGVARKLQEGGYISKDVQISDDKIYIVRKQEPRQEIKPQTQSVPASVVQINSDLPRPTTGSSTTLSVTGMRITPIGKVEKVEYAEPLSPKLSETEKYILTATPYAALGAASVAIPPLGAAVVGASAFSVGKSLGTAAGTSIREKDVTYIKEFGKDFAKTIVGPENVGFFVGGLGMGLYKSSFAVEQFRPNFVRSNVKTVSRMERTFIIDEGVFEKPPIQREVKIKSGEYKYDINKPKISEISDFVWSGEVNKPKEVTFKQPFDMIYKERIRQIEVKPITQVKERFWGLIKEEKTLRPHSDIIIRETAEMYKDENIAQATAKRDVEIYTTDFLTGKQGYKTFTDINVNTKKIPKDFITINTIEKNKGYVGDFYKLEKKKGKIIEAKDILKEPSGPSGEGKLKLKSKLKLAEKSENKKLESQVLEQQRLLKPKYKLETVFSKRTTINIPKIMYPMFLLNVKQKTKNKEMGALSSFKIDLNLKQPPKNTSYDIFTTRITDLDVIEKTKGDMKINETVLIPASITTLAPPFNRIFSGDMPGGSTSLDIIPTKFKKIRTKSDIIPLADMFEWSKKMKFPVYRKPTKKEKIGFLQNILTTMRFPYQKRR